MKASKPLSFTTASGAPMAGGLRGANFKLSVSLMGENGPYPANLGLVWGYEADLAGPDMIIGYPLLSRFGLMVDAGESCLRAPSIHIQSLEVAPSFSVNPGVAARSAVNPLEVNARSAFCLLYTSPSPRDQRGSRMPSSA